MLCFVLVCLPRMRWHNKLKCPVVVSRWISENVRIAQRQNSAPHRWFFTCPHLYQARHIVAHKAIYSISLCCFVHFYSYLATVDATFFLFLFCFWLFSSSWPQFSQRYVLRVIASMLKTIAEVPWLGHRNISGAYLKCSPRTACSRALVPSTE